MGALFERPAFLVLILLVLLLFGAKRLPDLARGVGRSLRIFKSETEGLRSDGSTAEAAPTTPAVTAAPAAPETPAVAPPAAADGPRYLVDPITGEKVLAQPVTPPADGTPRA
jgi:sec-independent protein translocase protein TatA